MASEFRIDGNLITGRVRLNGDPQQGVIGLPSAAWQGESAVAGIIIEDPDATLDLRGIHTVTWDETACTGAERIFTGWLTGKRVRRGKERGLATGVGRVWDCDVTDQNWIFHLEVFRASSAKRPEESDVERIQWAIASQVFGGTPIYDNGRFSTANATNMGPADFVTQYAINLFQATAGSIGKNFYAYWDDTANEISLHYDLVDNNPASTLSISNDMADVLADPTTVFYPWIDAEADLNPAPLVNGILFGYLGGQYVYVEDTDRFGPNEFSPDNFQRDEVYTTNRVGKLATANTLAATMLADRALEQDTIKCMIRLPNTDVNLLHAGMKVNAKFIHLDGYESGVDMAVIRRNVIPAPGRRDMYDVHLELSNKTSHIGPGGGGGGGPFEETACDIDNVAIVQDVHEAMIDQTGGVWDFPDWDSPPTEGNLLVIATGGEFDVGTINTGWTKIDGQPDTTFVGLGGEGGSVTAWWKIAGASETTPQLTGSSLGGGVPPDGHMIELSGVDQLDVHVPGADDPGGLDPGITLTPTADRVAFLLTIFSYSTTLSGLFNPDAGVTELYEGVQISNGGNPNWWIGYREVADTTGTYDMGGSFSGAFNIAWGWITMSFTCSGGGSVPGALMQVRGEFIANGDGTTTTFTTNYPYTPGSLDVFVDGVPIINGLTEIDPDAGTFSLDFAPQGAVGDTRAEIVTADYQAAVGGPGT